MNILYFYYLLIDKYNIHNLETESTAFKDQIKYYEYRYKNSDRYNPIDQPDIDVIARDIPRTFFKPFLSDEIKTLALKRICQEVILGLPFLYLQGMNDVIAVFICHYLKDEISHPTRVPTLTSEMKQIILTTVTNFYMIHLLPLICDEFKLFGKYDDIIINLLNEKGVNVVDTMHALNFGYISVFFCRYLSSKESVYDMFGLLMSKPIYYPFVVMGVYYNDLIVEKSITELDSIKLLLFEAKFVILISSMDSLLSNTLQYYIYFGVMIIIVGILIKNIINRKKDI